MPIVDQGYQHWKGKLSGRAWRWWAVARQGLRVQLRNRSVRILLLLAWSPALTLVAFLAVWGLFEQGSQGVLSLLQPLLPAGISADPRAYRLAMWTVAYSTFFKCEIVFIMLLMLVAGPQLISGDLRFNALPLYFSRPLGRIDYFLGKLGVLAVLVAAVAVLPAAAAYVLGVCFSLDLAVIRDTWRLLPASLAYGLVIVASAGTLMLALSSLSRRSLYVGIAWAALWVISSTAASVLAEIQRGALTQSVGGQEAVHFDPDDPPPARGSRRHAQFQRWEQIRERVEQAEAEAAPTNWRPLCSYTANLQRLGEALLQTDAAWVQLGAAIEAPRAAITPWFGRPGQSVSINQRRLANQLVPQYPWTWSAGVLAGLLGISLWILSVRVKSLDRLR